MGHIRGCHRGGEAGVPAADAAGRDALPSSLSSQRWHGPRRRRSGEGAARKLATNDALWHARGRFRTFRALRVRRIPRSPESRGPPARRIGPPECHRASFVANFPKALVKTGIGTSSCSSDIQAEPPLIGCLGGPCTRRAEPSEALRDPARAAGRSLRGARRGPARRAGPARAVGGSTESERVMDKTGPGPHGLGQNRPDSGPSRRDAREGRAFPQAGGLRF